MRLQRKLQNNTLRATIVSVQSKPKTNMPTPDTENRWLLYRKTISI
jgi:hypothetical protein